MRRKYIVLGDTTSHGGKVTSARGAGRMTYNGKPVACVGDIVYCPKCKGTHRIIEGAVKPPKWLDGVLVAVEGCRTSCGALLISVGQNIAGYEGEIGLDAVTVETLQTEAMAREAAEALAVSRLGEDRAVSLKDGLKSLQAESEEAEKDKWIEFTLNDVGSCEGLACVVHFDDGSQERAVFDEENKIRFDNVAGDQVERVEYVLADQPAGASVAELLLAKMGS